MADRELWLAFEGGGTRTRILLGNPEGEVLARETGSSASLLYVDKKRYAREMRPLLRRLKKSAEGLRGKVSAAGLVAPMDKDLVVDLISEAFGAVRMVQAGEQEVGLACHHLRCGVCIVAGTGTSCQCLDEKGGQVVLGGFGPQFGDEGSGYWIAREGIAAAWRAEEHRNEPTALTARVRTHYGVAHVQEILERVDSSGHVPGPVVASFAAQVAEAARQDRDGTARNILRRAGGHLGRLVRAALAQSALQERPAPLVPAGGVFGAGNLVLASMRETLHQAGMDVRLYAPVLDPAPGLFRVMAWQREKGLW